MLIRLSTAASLMILLKLMAIRANAGIVPVARAAYDLDKRSDTVGNYADPYLYAEPAN